ncbi:MAG: hypothetical protein ACI8YQ_002053 [Polaribacter sp.]|jgi:hypothetical protein
MQRHFLILSLLLSSLPIFAQIGNQIIPNEAPPKFHLALTSEKITLDGQLNEATWKKAEQLSQFTQYFPLDTVPACGETEILMAYDADNLYIAAKCYTPADQFLVQSLKRDYGFGATDNISFLFDTYNDKNNCYLFGMNPFGARREALIFNGGKSNADFDNSWDNKWYGESKKYENYWICELAIPLKILRFKEGATQWRFNSYRNDTQCNEISTWVNIPREYILMDMNYMGDMIWEKPLDKPGKNVSLIPYISGGLTRDFEDSDQSKAKRRFNVGGDAKIAISSSMNLDLTVNPDFSQVEVDQQVTNLDRFEIFFPERRQFFLENADLFGSFGTGRINPFFSRRIGISLDTITGNNIQNTIYGGARLTGKINDRLRIGLISMQTASQEDNDLPSFNYSILAVEQNVFHRSSIAAIVVNKQAFNYDDFGNTYSEFNRVAGLEYRLKSKDNYWAGKANIMNAFSPGDNKNSLAHLASIEYNRKRYRLEVEQIMTGNGFNVETGFAPRKDNYLISPEVDIRFFPASSKVISHTLGADVNFIYKLGKDDSEIITDFGLEEFNSTLFWNTRFSNNTNFRANINYTEATLLDDFDPTRIQEDTVFLDAGYKFRNTILTLSYNSDRRKPVYGSFSPLVGKFFGGSRAGFRSSLSYRFLPYGSISVNANYNYINLDAPFKTANLWLIGPRIDITFTRNHFLSIFAQYNNQLNNVSINTRYQWRFAPASDFFIVYSDNYDTDPADPWASRNRGVVAKLTYWLNL